MNSYTINASVFAYTLGNSPKMEEFNNYAKTIRTLNDLVNRDRPRHIKYYFFKKDKKYFAESNERLKQLDACLSNDQINENNARLIKNKIRETMLNNQKLFDTLIAALRDNQIEKYIIFEKWFGINKDKIKYIADKKPILPEYILEKIQDEELRENLKDHFAMIAVLNEIIYNNSDTHSVIVGNDIVSADDKKHIPVTTEFNISMVNYQYDGRNYVYRINGFPLTNVKIENRDVKVSAFDELLKRNNKYTWKEAFDDAKKLKNLKFGLECEKGIEQYMEEINIRRKKLKPNEVYVVDKWLSNFPETLFSNLKILSDYLSFYKEKPDKTEPIPVGCLEGKHCRNYLSILCNYCNSNIHFFGADCSDEGFYHKSDDCVKRDRTKKDNNGIDGDYWHHIKPFKRLCYDPLWFLSLRIHFRLIDSNETIEIGWIGRHLYLPCNTQRDLPNCNRSECPLHPKYQYYDAKEDELANFLKQYMSIQQSNLPE